MEKECEFCGKPFEARNCKCRFCSPRCRWGTKVTKAERDERDKKIVELRRQNLSCREIGEILGTTEGVVLTVSKKYGVDGRRAPYATGTPNQFTKRTEEEKRVYVEEFLDCERFEYIDGYEHCDSKVRLKCKTCGLIFERSMVCIRKRMKTTCPDCDFDRKPIECDAIKLGKRKILREKYIDRGISAVALMERDGGICQLCGLRCDIDDYQVREDGSVVCGEYYPSVDHIIPISKGGLHSWSNVRLAHRRCNVIEYVKEQRFG